MCTYAWTYVCKREGALTCGAKVATQKKYDRSIIVTLHYIILDSNKNVEPAYNEVFILSIILNAKMLNPWIFEHLNSLGKLYCETICSVLYFILFFFMNVHFEFFVFHFLCRNTQRLSMTSHSTKRRRVWERKRLHNVHHIKWGTECNALDPSIRCGYNKVGWIHKKLLNRKQIWEYEKFMLFFTLKFRAKLQYGKHK